MGAVGVQRSSAMANSRPSSDLAEFRKLLASAKRVVVLTVAGVSAESGVPTFRGAGGFWRTYQAQDLASPEAFERDPSLVWEFYHYRREVMLSKSPNPAHLAIAECAERLKAEGRRMRVITQNIDELHTTAGTKDLVELHGSLFRVCCVDCEEVTENRDSPICKALEGRGAPDPEAQAARIPEKDLPRCKQPSCGGLLRPNVVWPAGLVKGLTKRFLMLPKMSWKNVTSAWWLAPVVLSILLPCLHHRLRQGGFLLQNSTWRQLLQLEDLEDMAFSSKEPVEQPYPQHLPHESPPSIDSPQFDSPRSPQNWSHCLASLL